MLGIAEEYDWFDTDIILHINSALATLAQLGVGPTEGYSIEDISNTWSDYLHNEPRLNLVKTYMYLKVKLGFDPPTNSATIEAINRQINELEWRINSMTESIYNDE